MCGIDEWLAEKDSLAASVGYMTVLDGRTLAVVDDEPWICIVEFKGTTVH